jgi:hypothetical protein
MYFYKRGEFLEAYKADSTPNLYKLWSLLYTADKRLISSYLRKFIRETQSEKKTLGWDRRAFLYFQVLLLTNNEKSAFVEASSNLTTLIKLNDEHDRYFSSLGVLLHRISKVGNSDFTISDRNTHLIGDSHCLPMSLSWNFDKGGVTFLPGVTTRELSSVLKQPAEYALENAVRSSQADRIVFSIGEIDQREIYYRIESYLADEEKIKERFQLQLHSALSKLSSLRSPYQDAFVVAMPPFFENQVRKADLEKSANISDWINWYGTTFNEVAIDVGLGILGRRQMAAANDSDKIDQSHFHPEFYRSFRLET